MSKEVLIEYRPFTPTPQSLNESKLNKEGKFIVEGVVQRADALNENGRVYPRNILDREVQKYIEGPIAQNRAMGELDHPESSIINLKNVCHNILKLWWDGDDLFGRIEILPTPSGNILKALIQSGITVGISSRGMGSVKPLGEGKVEVQDDFDLLCWDFVSTPSTHGAYMKLVVGLNESKQHNQINKYSKINELVTDIICSQTGVCCIR